MKTIRGGILFLILLCFAAPGVSTAAEGGGGAGPSAIDAAKGQLQLNINIVWTCVAAFLVFFMQAGFNLDSGLFYGGGLKQLGVQALGAGAAFIWAFGLGLALFYGIKAPIGLRVSTEEEAKGLDLGEHGMEAYAGFQIFTRYASRVYARPSGQTAGPCLA